MVQEMNGSIVFVYWAMAGMGFTAGVGVVVPFLLWVYRRVGVLSR